MIEILIYINMLLLLFTMFSIAWKNLLKSLCRRYLVIQKINFINNNQKEYIKYINLLIEYSYSFSIYEHIISVFAAEKMGLFKNIDKYDIKLNYFFYISYINFNTYTHFFNVFNGI